MGFNSNNHIKCHALGVECCDNLAAMKGKVGGQLYMKDEGVDLLLKV